MTNPEQSPQRRRRIPIFSAMSERINAQKDDFFVSQLDQIVSVYTKDPTEYPRIRRELINSPRLAPRKQEMLRRVERYEARHKQDNSKKL